jgi:hypothetical protein
MMRIFRRIRIFLSDLSDWRLREIRKILRQRGYTKAKERLLLSSFSARKDELLAYLKAKQDEGK